MVGNPPTQKPLSIRGFDLVKQPVQLKQCDNQNSSAFSYCDLAILHRNNDGTGYITTNKDLPTHLRLTGQQEIELNTLAVDANTDLEKVACVKDGAFEIN